MKLHKAAQANLAEYDRRTGTSLSDPFAPVYEPRQYRHKPTMGKLLASGWRPKSDPILKIEKRTDRKHRNVCWKKREPEPGD